MHIRIANAPAPAPETTTFERTYPGIVSHIRQVRADLTAFAAGYPRIDDLVLLASELSANAAQHSMSRQPGGTFTVRAELHPGEYAWAEVEDQGGEWVRRTGEERTHGLNILAAIAGPGNWGTDGGPACRVAWFRLDWRDQDQDQDAAS